MESDILEFDPGSAPPGCVTLGRSPLHFSCIIFEMGSILAAPQGCHMD